MKTPADQQQGLSALEMLSYDPQYHASIHEPSVIQNLYFFIRAPPSPPTLQQLELLTLASSILANVCIGFPKLADDLILLGMYREIVKVLHLLEKELSGGGGGAPPPMPLPPALPSPDMILGGGVGGGQRKVVVELAVEKVVGLLVNLQAKKKNQTLPYVEEDEGSGGAGDEILEVCVKLLKVEGIKANRGVMLCLKNLMHEGRLLKKMLANEAGLSLICSRFAIYFARKQGQKLGEGGIPVIGGQNLSSSSNPVSLEGAAIDWLWAFSLFAWHSDELLSLMKKHQVADSALHVLSVSATTQSPTSGSGSGGGGGGWALLQMESARIVSFLTYSGCEGLVSPADVLDVFLNLMVGGGGPWNVSPVEMSALVGRLGGGKVEDIDLPNQFLKIVANVLANISIGDEEVVLGMVKDDRLLVRLVGVLEEGDRTSSLTQVFFPFFSFSFSL